MNPAILVLLWIRLSVTFGYPATLTELRSISPKGFSTLSFANPLQTQPMFDVEKTSTGAQQYTTQSYNVEDQTFFTDSSEPSPKYTNFPFDTTMHSQPNDTQILSIVRVSSTSVVKPRARSRLATTVLATTNQHFTQTDADFGTKSKGETSFEELVTPFVSLLRKNRLDIDENYPKERLSIATATSRNYELPSYEVKFSRVTFDLSSSTRIVGSTGFGSYVTKPTTTVETTTEATETTYTDSFESTASGRERTDTSYYDSYDERQYTQPRVYGEPEKVYGEPEKVYGEPEKVYGEPEKVYGEPEKVYGEPEKVYSPKVYEPSTQRTVQTSKTFKAEEIIHEQPETEENEFQLPETSEMNSKSYSSFTTKINDKKSSYIVDNGTYRKYRVEEKTPDGFIVGEYGMVSHRDGSLRGVRYTADSNINPSLIYETLVKFLSLT